MKNTSETEQRDHFHLPSKKTVRRTAVGLGIVGVVLAGADAIDQLCYLGINGYTYIEGETPPPGSHQVSREVTSNHLQDEAIHFSVDLGILAAAGVEIALARKIKEKPKPGELYITDKIGPPGSPLATFRRKT